MEKNKNQSIEAMLREHEHLEQLIQEKFRKELTILFTDICGYTHYMETHGDLKGRVMLQKHNDILLPLIKKYNGVVIKTIGDAVMARFEFPAEAVYAAVDIQNGLEEYNQNTEDKIHVKIGINSGNVLVDNTDVFGDAVNVAARIQSKAGKDEILISERLFQEICEDRDFICKFYDTAKLKGKSEAIKLYQVLWRENNILLHSKSKIRSQSQQTRSRKEKRENPEITLYLEAMSVNDRLKLSIYEQMPGETGTVRHYEEIPVPLDTIAERCREIAETLNKANRQGCVSKDILVKLRGIGQIFFDDLLTHTVKEKLRNTVAEYLILNIDDTLVHVPWELLHDGNQFLCQRFSMGRLVRTKQTIPGAGKSRLLSKPLNMLILADPGGDLNGAYSEGIQLRDNMDKQNDLIHSALRADAISADYIRENMRNFDILHYAGHSDYDRENPAESGWRLSQGRFSAYEIMKMAGTGEMPSLIFSNACQSARTEEWKITSAFHDEIFGLANAFVLAGVRHYVGTFWEILDEPSRRFALEFYRELLSGISIGKAVRNARLVLIQEYGEETIVWASYLLYGDPTFNYLHAMPEKEDKKPSSFTPNSSTASKSKTRIRASESDALYSNKAWENTDKPVLRKKRGSRMGLLITGILLLTMMFGAYQFFSSKLQSDKEILQYESSAMTAYKAGNFEEALNLSKSIEDEHPNSALSYLIQGHIYLRQGKSDAAQKAYQQAVQASENTSQQKASALMGLGRISSIQNQKDAALKYYQQAAEIKDTQGFEYSESLTEALMAQAMILNEKGEHEATLKILEKAQKHSPENRLIADTANEIRKRISFLQDKEKQERINILVKELLERRSQDPEVRGQESGFRRERQPNGLPLTLWLIDFESVGYSVQEGESQLLGIGITNALLQDSKIRLVERVLLDKLLEELKLGTSKLTDQNTALSLGKIMAARLILSGKIIHAGNHKEISVRMIETETGLISGAVSESFGGDVSISVLSEKLSEKLLNKIRESVH